MFGSLQQSVKASFADRFDERGHDSSFRPVRSGKPHSPTPGEADAGISQFAAVVERADETRGRVMKAIIPAVILWAFLCLILRHNVSREWFGNSFYIATAMALMMGMPAFAYGQFWFSAYRHCRNLGVEVTGRPSIDAPLVDGYRTRNPFQFALRWTAAMALGAFILIGGILPESNPQLAQELKPWIDFEFGTLLVPLGILYGLSMLWDWIAARKAAS